MAHREGEITSDSRIGILGSCLINLDQVVYKICGAELFLLRGHDVRQLVSFLPAATQLRSCANFIEIFLRRFLLIGQIAKKKKDSNADRDDDEREQEKLRDEKRSRLFYFNQFVRGRYRHTSRFYFHMKNREE